jgi:hypothetical protein
VGLEPANVHPLVLNLCLRPEGDVNHALYVALHTSMSWDEALDLEEIVIVGRTWRDAAQANAAYWAKARQQ